jgi:DNA polymerase II large subunit
MVEASLEIKNYFQSIDVNLKKCYKIAKKARSKGLDPELDVAIPVAKNMAERVVGLISVVAPNITNTNITERITELEKKYGQLDWRVGLVIAEEVAKEKFCKFESTLEAIEIGIRTGFAYLTLGIVSAPLEGFIGLKIKKRRDGKEYFAPQYAGPIRGAGGTAASTSVILTDYVRVKLGYSTYDPEEQEINRYTTEIHDYHERVTNLQYHPSDDELKFILSHLPVEVDGDPTEKFEVSNYKDLPRIDTNLIRGGMALVVAEGLSQKAPKLWKKLSKWGKEMGLEWDWLEEFIKLKENIHSSHHKDDGAIEEQKVKPNNTFIMDLVAGRPILTHPMAEGGFRLRYGRNRTSGFSATALHPATLVVLNKYIAIGTQLKMERPGKAATVTACDTLEGPIVLLENGDVKKLNSEDEAKEFNATIKEVIFLGDILFNYGDFSENGHSLVPAGYCSEWWALEVNKALKNTSQESIFNQITQDRLNLLINEPLLNNPTFNESIIISTIFKLPLHPEFTFYWKLINFENLSCLVSWLNKGKLKKDENEINKLILPLYESNLDFKRSKKILEKLGVPHKVINKENVVIEKNNAKAICVSFNINSQEDLLNFSLNDTFNSMNGLEIINKISKLKINDKVGTFIGSRMGRPEKAKMRQLTGSPQVMFPVGEEGDRLRSFQSALQAKKIRSMFPLFFCTACNSGTIYGTCEKCNQPTIKKFYCRFCGDLDQKICRHGEGFPYKNMDIDINYYFTHAQKMLGEKVIPDLIKGVRGTSNKEHVVEHLAKGILRAKHNIYVNKDGTTRYDCTELPLTHFKPKEIKTSVPKLIELGYTKDIRGLPLENEDQLLEIKPQDVIVPGFESFQNSGPNVLTRIANFVDNLLVDFYHLKPYYNIQKQEDLVGHLVIGLAPHISAGMVGRIIGFSETQGLLTNPMFHAGMRRDCDGDEACVMLLLDALLNFSRQYLPERRGAKTMDAPLVLTSILNPAEVDDQVHGMDVCWKYPLEFYEAALKMKNPWEVIDENGKKIEQLGDRLGTNLQYESFGFTHHVENFNKAVQCSAYKTLPSMEEKLIGQMEIARRVRAVDLNDVAKLVIQKHFLKDIKGNLRKFSMQQFRCVKCNQKYRRPPLSSMCTNCNGKLIFTISEGSVVKYLHHSLNLAEKYDFSPYLKQTLDLLKTNVDNIFGKEKDKQVGLGTFMK